MPKIKIIEKDSTSSASISGVDNIVYVPGEAGEGSTLVTGKPVLFKDAESFKKAVNNNITELGQIVAYNLLLQGLYVLYEAIEVSEGTPTFAWDKLKDKSLYDIRFITSGGHASPKDMIAIAEARKDCVALMNPGETVLTATDVKAYVTGFGTAAEGWKYASVFAPWCSMNVAYTQTVGGSSVIKYGDKNMPAVFAYLCAYANSVKSNPTWYAAAGAVRGQIPGLLKPLIYYGESDIDLLQCRTAELDATGDNTGSAINPICEIKPYGVVVWGNRTLIKNEGSLSASSFLNIRNLVSELVKTLYKASRRMTFEQNNDILWVNFKALITPLLDKMVSGNGIGGYKIIKEQTTAKARLKARIKIVPIEAVEDFELTVELADSLAEVAEA